MRQLFNEFDPAPFRDHDLVPPLVIYQVRAVEELSRKRHLTARYFSLIGLVALIVCLTIAQFIESIKLVTIRVSNIASVSFVIISWVAMWHPNAALLYNWWPISEQRQYFDKIAQLDVMVVDVDAHV